MFYHALCSPARLHNAGVVSGWLGVCHFRILYCVGKIQLRDAIIGKRVLKLLNGTIFNDLE